MHIHTPNYFAKPDTDVTALQGMLDNGTLLLGPHTYDLGSTGLIVKNGCSIIGSGAATVLSYTGSGTAIDINGGAAAAATTRDVMLRDFSLSGANSGNGVTIGRTSGSPVAGQCQMNNVLITNFAIGLNLQSAQICGFDYVRVRGCTTGMKSTDDNRDTNNVFIRCNFRDNDQRGAQIHRMDGCKFITCSFELNGYEGLYMETLTSGTGARIHDIEFDNCWFEGNNDAGGRTSGYGEVYVTNAVSQPSQEITMRKCIFGALVASEFHIHLDGGEDVVQFDCEFDDATAFDFPTTGTPARVMSPGRIGRLWGFPSGPYGGRLWTVADEETSPDAPYGDIMVIDNTTSTTILTLETYAIQAGEYVWLHIKDANTTLTHGSGSKAMRLQGSTNYTPAANTFMLFYFDGTEWIEMYRGTGGVPT